MSDKDRGAEALFVLWHGGDWLLTWHAPWCRDDDCALQPSGWRSLAVFSAERGYLRGLGLELSWC